MYIYNYIYMYIYVVYTTYTTYFRVRLLECETTNWDKPCKYSPVWSVISRNASKHHNMKVNCSNNPRT